MEQRTGNLTTFYQGWSEYQAMLVDAIAPLTADHLALRAAPNQRPVWLIAAHIIGTRVGWFHTFMGEGDQSIAAYDPWDADGAPPRTAAELVDGLATTWTMIEACLDRWTADDLTARFVRHIPEGDFTRTRGWVIWHVLEHDIHHGGELFLTLGSHGLPTPDM